MPHVVLAITGSVQQWDLAQKDAVQREAVLLRESHVKLMIASIDPTQSNQGYLRSLVDSQEHLYMLSYHIYYTVFQKISQDKPVPFQVSPRVTCDLLCCKIHRHLFN